jgi:hypothetical protein
MPVLTDPVENKILYDPDQKKILASSLCPPSPAPCTVDFNWSVSYCLDYIPDEGFDPIPGDFITKTGSVTGQQITIAGSIALPDVDHIFSTDGWATGGGFCFNSFQQQVTPNGLARSGTNNITPGLTIGTSTFGNLYPSSPAGWWLFCSLDLVVAAEDIGDYTSLAVGVKTFVTEGSCNNGFDGVSPFGLFLGANDSIFASDVAFSFDLNRITQIGGDPCPVPTCTTSDGEDPPTMLSHDLVAFLSGTLHPCE